MTRKPTIARTRTRPSATGAATVRKPGRSRAAGGSQNSPYHHGALRDALLGAADATGTTPMEKALARAKAYVAYAQAHPGMYGLMFRTERLDMSRPSLHEAARTSFAGLAGAIGANRQEQISEEALSLDQAAAIARAWSLVHGFTMLLLDGRLADILRRLPQGTDAETLLDAMLRATIGRPPGS